MGAVYHWVTKINITLVIAVTIGTLGFVQAASLIADGLKGIRVEINNSTIVSTNHHGKVKTWKIVDGVMEEVK